MYCKRLSLNKDIKFISFKTKEHIQKKEGGPDIPISNN